MNGKTVPKIMLALLMITLLTYAVNVQPARCVKVGDVNKDGSVDILDIVIVVLAFGSTSVDPNWNPAADVNGDGVINIFDLVAVAIDFDS